jgi:hypothetical protein
MDHWFEMTDYALFAKYPQNRASFERLIENDSEFETICKDYDACEEALRYWSTSKSPEAGTRVKEYQELSGELEKEAQRYLAPSE